MYREFVKDIVAMNSTYDLASVNTDSWLSMMNRLAQFKEILDKEFVELDDIIAHGNTATDGNSQSVKMDMRVMVADICADIIVYCASELVRWNIDPAMTLQIVMASNFSKLGEDGKPIKNPVTDKFEKGPNYWKPEPYIQMMFENKPLAAVRDRTDLPGLATLQIIGKKDPEPATGNSQEV